MKLFPQHVRLRHFFLEPLHQLLMSHRLNPERVNQRLIDGVGVNRNAVDREIANCLYYFDEKAIQLFRPCLDGTDDENSGSQRELDYGLETSARACFQNFLRELVKTDLRREHLV